MNFILKFWRTSNAEEPVKGYRVPIIHFKFEYMAPPLTFELRLGTVIQSTALCGGSTYVGV
jgi:hypothetical protein